MKNIDSLIEKWEKELRKELRNAKVDSINEIESDAYKFRCYAIREFIADLKILNGNTEKREKKSVCPCKFPHFIERDNGKVTCYNCKLPPN